jgi:exoribonuclease II
MHVLYEEGGRFIAGRLMSEAESSLQLELDSGKRVKLKAAQALLRFAAPAPAELLAQARVEAEGIELELAWEFVPEGGFGFADLAREYFGGTPSSVHQAAALLRLFEAPHYFRRLGRGQFKKAPQEQVQAALLGIERKRQQAEQVATWAADLAAGRCPEAVASQLFRILFKPDKNAPEYKAVVEAARHTQQAPLALLQASGAITSPYQFHWKRFVFEQFPQGAGFPALMALAAALDLPRAAVQAFSIDDSTTTEIDDALSVQGLGSGRVVLGIHIAAPGLAITPGSPVDAVARERLSTVYMPGGKLTMLPDEVVQAYTLAEGRDCPALSLYVQFDENTLAVLGSQTRLEQVPVAANLRHDLLDAAVSEDALEGRAPASFPYATELSFCWRLAQHLKAAREIARGKPENFTRPDYSFKLDGVPSSGEPTGDEVVHIGVRRRGAPLDLIVAEAMILANSHWGGWLAERGVPGIYRSQASLAPGVKVRMGTRAAPHAGMGVAQYAWSTSPLRRYVDLVNQWQLIACVQHGSTAALAAPFKPKDASLMSVVSSFEATYAAYADFQHHIERYWTLRWLQQQGVTELDGAVLKEGLVRAATLPLVFRVPGTEAWPRGAGLRVRVAGIDLLNLELHAVLLARLDQTSGSTAPTTAADDEADEADAADAVGLQLAIDTQPLEEEAAPAAG